MSEQQFEYDVFLSHASADKAGVRELAQRLKGDGLRVWLDEWLIQVRRCDPVAKRTAAGKLADVGPGHELGRLRLSVGHPRTTHPLFRDPTK